MNIKNILLEMLEHIYLKELTTRGREKGGGIARR